MVGLVTFEKETQGRACVAIQRRSLLVSSHLVTRKPIGPGPIVKPVAEMPTTISPTPLMIDFIGIDTFFYPPNLHLSALPDTPASFDT
eukprot:1136787-Pelagomonas_calceolata.AAC.10